MSRIYSIPLSRYESKALIPGQPILLLRVVESPPIPFSALVILLALFFYGFMLYFFIHSPPVDRGLYSLPAVVPVTIIVAIYLFDYNFVVQEVKHFIRSFRIYGQIGHAIPRVKCSEYPHIF